MKLSLDTCNEAPEVETVNSARNLLSRDQLAMDQILANYEEDDHITHIDSSRSHILETERGLMSPDVDRKMIRDMGTPAA